MAKRLDRTLEWARIGAGARLLEIERERIAILKQFPELRRGAGRQVVARTGGTRPKLTPAARRKLSAGMRKYWARRKAQAASKS
jgi:hypothetical protein